jgi:transcriptional regulator of acetoin/glycerol metabolism
MPQTSTGRQHAPHQLFFRTAEQRTALARQQFFDEGARPSGLVGEAVIQSWLRCCKARQDPGERVSFEQVTRSRAHATLNRNRQLMQAGNHELNHMEEALSGTDCRVLLTDAHGVIIHATELTPTAGQPLLKTASRVGVNIAETHIGTTAPGIVVRSGEACTVAGAEHFFQCLQGLHCAAAPIHDIHGQLAGVLDISVEGGPFHFDAASVVGLYATTIENRLLQLQSVEHLVLHFQASPTLLDTPLEALAGIDASGRVLWLNAVARRLTGCTAQGQPMVEDVFGATLGWLLGLPRQTSVQTLHLPHGLGVWIKGRLTAPDGADFKHAVPVSRPTPQAPVQPQLQAAIPEAESDNTASRSTLVDHSQRLIESTLAQCGGNIAKAARALGVSRGMLYRRLQKARGQEGDAR